MEKGMEKNTVRHAMIWIAIYIVLVNIGGIISEAVGIENSATSVIVVVFSILSLMYLKKNDWFEQLGLRKITKSDLQKTLRYLPLAILVILQFSNGIKSSISSSALFFTCLMMIGIGFLEELIFRGFLFTAILKKSGMNRAVIISGVTFGLGHIVNLFRGYGFQEQIIQILVAGGIGIVLALLVAITNNIIPGVLFHIAFNISGSISNPASGQQELIGLVAILMICAVYTIYLLKTIKTNKVKYNEVQIPVSRKH